MWCSECAFFRGDGICRNPKSRKREVGYFQKACTESAPILTDKKASGIFKSTENMEQTASEPKPKRRGPRAKVSTESTTVNHKTVTDAELVAELTARGYNGTLTKTVTYEL